MFIVAKIDFFERKNLFPFDQSNYYLPLHIISTKLTIMAKNIEEIKAALAEYGITGVKDVYYNPSYEQLFKDEMNPALTGYDKGVLTELNAVNVMTGIYTGRSPKDKYIVMDKNSKDTVWWTTEGYKNDNHPMSEGVWAQVKDLAKKQLSG